MIWVEAVTENRDTSTNYNRCNDFSFTFIPVRHMKYKCMHKNAPSCSKPSFPHKIEVLLYLISEHLTICQLICLSQ